LPNEVFKATSQGDTLKEITIAECSERNGQVVYQGKHYVPEGDQLQLRLIQEHHDTAFTGHQGSAKTIDLLDRQYYQKEMRKWVHLYVRNCHSCQRSSTSQHATLGDLQPLPVPEKPWEDISMDFVVRLPECEGFDAVWVVVDTLWRIRHLIPCHTIIDAVGLGKLFLREVIRHHGLPTTIVSNRGTKFSSSFWR
jgi:hypothetical protein